jgi:hypothetical protein
VLVVSVLIMSRSSSSSSLLMSEAGAHELMSEVGSWVDRGEEYTVETASEATASEAADEDAEDAVSEAATEFSFVWDQEGRNVPDELERLITDEIVCRTTTTTAAAQLDHIGRALALSCIASTRFYHQQHVRSGKYNKYRFS